MNKKIHPSLICGMTKAPPSKSYMQRAVAIALLAKGRTVIHNPSFCNDAMSAIGMARELGAEIQINPSEVIINGTGKLMGAYLSAGESGLGIRIFAAIAALANEKISLSGEGSLMKRTLHMLVEPLQNLGAEIKTNNSFLPLVIKGPLKGGKVKVDGQISSQFLSGLLIALPMIKQDSIIEVSSLQSKPYIDMTLDIIQQFGVAIENQNYETFYINGGQEYTAQDYSIEGDWSGASFHLVAGAIAGNVSIKNLNIDSKQADLKIVMALKLVGADVNYIKSDSQNNYLIKVKRNKLNAFNFDATHCPDLFPPLVILGAVCKGVSSIKGVNRLKNKESDRANVLINEMVKMGISIINDGDNMIIEGGTLHSANINSHNDHRIAMAAAIAALITQNGIIIEGAEAINKSYPGFFDDLEKLTLQC